ncbi:MULE transposase domain-containing protein [Phytophthora infestans]|uniref:MULE transposase domain-containing protein n=1 Tax=Phytophthora infestans TaxID=4787 RepID=A0A833RPM5_PHYIN|nr:MULE transposase domain-containing protein [Phytophthora infestans]KAF4136589.1 MULE transposase domain-containing protein [Phytophthora infestans]
MDVDVDDISEGSDSSGSACLTVGMVFESATDALHAVQDYALSLGKAVKVRQRSGVHRLIGCSSDGCEFSVRVYRKRRSDKTYGPWYISSIANDHVNCLSIANPTRRQITELPTFISAVSADGSVTAGALIDQIQSRDGISLGNKRRTLYRAKEAVDDISKEDLVQSYSKIPSYLSNFSELNPGSIALAEKDSLGHFKRAIVIVKVFADAARARQGVVGADCSHSKCPSYSGVQMHLAGRDGNLRNVTIAFGLVEAEDFDNYKWFFSTLDKHGYSFRGVPMFCDRSGSLISVATEMRLNLKYCTLHIIRNLLGRFRKFTHGHKNLVWSLQSSDTKELYTSRLEWIGLSRAY